MECAESDSSSDGHSVLSLYHSSSSFKGIENGDAISASGEGQGSATEVVPYLYEHEDSKSPFPTVDASSEDQDERRLANLAWKEGNCFHDFLFHELYT